jgi:hypothetical protein
MSRKCFVLLVGLLAALVPVGIVAGNGASGAGSRVEIGFLACVDFLSPPAFPPCISGEFNGDTIETTGSGAFRLDEDGDGEVRGSGTFIHRNPVGVVVGQGTWTAKKFLAYRTYGCDGCPAGLPEGSEGGSLLITSQLDPDGPSGKFDATLEINCALGTVPPNRAYDGVELRVLGLRFDQGQGGATLFIRE